MNKYRVLKPYPKQITNSGRLVTLQKGRDIYLKREPQVIRLVRMGFIKPIVELPKKKEKPAKKQIQASKSEPANVENKSNKEEQDYKKKSKSEYLKKK